MTLDLRTAFSALALLALGTGSGFAQTKPSQVAWDLKTVQLVKAGDAARGKTLHAACIACHGEAGIGSSPEFPDLAAQAPLYTYKQLHDYKSGARPNGIMESFVGGLSDGDMADLAQFYAQQKRGGKDAVPVPEPAVMSLIQLGDGGRMIVACVYCHGPRGRGNPGMYGMPALEGQKGAYLQQTLLAFQSGERHNDTYRAMRHTVKSLSASEIAWLASYYSGERIAPPPATAPAPAPAPAAAPKPEASAAAAPVAAAGAGWYTPEQAAKGEKLYAAQCAMCHGATLGGSMGPALKGKPFWTKWGAKPFSAVWKEIHARMPIQAPGSDGKGVSIDILAFLLAQNGVAAGKTPLNDGTDLTRALPAQ